MYLFVVFSYSSYSNFTSGFVCIISSKLPGVKKLILKSNTVPYAFTMQTIKSSLRFFSLYKNENGPKKFIKPKCLIWWLISIDGGGWGDDVKIVPIPNRVLDEQILGVLSLLSHHRPFHLRYSSIVCTAAMRNKNFVCSIQKNKSI